MVNKKLKIVFSLFLSLILVLGPVFISAQKGLELEYPKFPGVPELTEKTSLSDYVAYIFNFIIFASGFILFGVLIWGGILYLISAGDPNRRKAAKDRILGGFIGVFIIFSSYIIITTINPGFIIVHISKEGIQLAEPGKPPPEPPEEEKKIYDRVQIPAGKEVEKAVLDDAARDFLELAEASVVNTAEDAKDKSRELAEASLVLKEHVEKCRCEKPVCPGCVPIACNVSADCGLIAGAAQRVIEGIKALAETENEIRQNHITIINKMLAMKKLTFPMSTAVTTGEDVPDYKTERTLERYIEKEGKEIITHTFAEWKDPGQDPDNLLDDTLLMDIRTGFKDRENLPPTFDPATFYLEKNKKTDVFLQKANLLRPTVLLPDLGTLIAEAMERTIKEQIISALRGTLGLDNKSDAELRQIAQGLFKEEELSQLTGRLFGGKGLTQLNSGELQQLIFESIKPLSQRLITNDLTKNFDKGFGIDSLRSLLDALSDELSEEITGILTENSISDLGINTIEALEQEIKNWYRKIAGTFNINIPEDLSEEFTKNLIGGLGCSSVLETYKALEETFGKLNIFTLEDLSQELGKSLEQLENELRGFLGIELSVEIELNDLINALNDKLYKTVGEINIVGLELEEALEDLGIQDISELAGLVTDPTVFYEVLEREGIERLEDLINQATYQLIEDLGISGIEIKIESSEKLATKLNEILAAEAQNILNSFGIDLIGLQSEFENALSELSKIVFNITSLDGLLTTSLKDLLNDVTYDLFRGLEITDFAHLADRLPLLDIDGLEFELRNYGISTLNGLISEVANKLTGGLINELDIRTIESLDGLEDLDEILRDKVYSILIDDFNLGPLPEIFKTDISTALTDLLGPSFRNLLDDSLGDLLGDLSRDLFRDLGIYSLGDLAGELLWDPTGLKNQLEIYGIDTFNDLISGVARELTGGLINGDINWLGLNENSIEDLSLDTLWKLNDRLSEQVYSILIEDFNLGSLPTDLRADISNTLSNLLNNSNNNSLEGLVGNSLNGFLGDFAQDFFDEMNLFTLADFPDTMTNRLREQGINTLNELINGTLINGEWVEGIASRLTGGLINGVDPTIIDGLLEGSINTLDIAKALNERLKEEIGTLIFDFNIGDLPLELGVDIPNVIDNLLNGSFENFVDDSLNGLLDDVTTIAFEQLGIDDWLGLAGINDILTIDFEGRLSMDWDIASLQGLAGKLAKEVTDDLLDNLEIGSLESFGIRSLEELNERIIGGVGGVLSKMGIELPGDYASFLPEGLNLFDLDLLASSYENALKNLGIETIEKFLDEKILPELNNLLLEEWGLDFIFPEGIGLSGLNLLINHPLYFAIDTLMDEITNYINLDLFDLIGIGDLSFEIPLFDQIIDIKFGLFGGIFGF